MLRVGKILQNEAKLILEIGKTLLKVGQMHQNFGKNLFHRELIISAHEANKNPLEIME